MAWMQDTHEEHTFCEQVRSRGNMSERVLKTRSRNKLQKIATEQPWHERYQTPAVETICKIGERCTGVRRDLASEMACASSTFSKHTLRLLSGGAWARSYSDRKGQGRGRTHRRQRPARGPCRHPAQPHAHTYNQTLTRSHTLAHSLAHSLTHLRL
eukprot:1081519-Pleurochrysis_carterae.AAC.2